MSTLSSIEQAIGNEAVLEFDYEAAGTGELSHRRVRPEVVLHGVKGTYLVGEDLDKDAPRNFRLANIENLEVV